MNCPKCSSRMVAIGYDMTCQICGKYICGEIPVFLPMPAKVKPNAVTKYWNDLARQFAAEYKAVVVARWDEIHSMRAHNMTWNDIAAALKVPVQRLRKIVIGLEAS